MHVNMHQHCICMYVYTYIHIIVSSLYDNTLKQIHLKCRDSESLTFLKLYNY